jgi:CubicO group peptidase (beta-lactamase class C family)
LSRPPAARVQAGARKPRGNVRREGGRVWIEGLPDEKIGGGWLAMLRGVGVLLKHRGEEVTEAELLAYSGDAFHLCFADKWQYMGYMAIPTDIVANVLSACGYEGGLRHSEPMPKGAAAQEAVTAKVLERFRAEIEAGRPVLVGGSSDGGCCDWSVVVGYEKPTGKLCHMGIGKPYRWTGVRGIDFPLDGKRMATCWNSQTRGTAKPNFVGGWIDNAHVILGRKAARPDERTRAIAVLQRAVQLHRAPTHDPRWGWKFHFGAKAYQKWAEAMDKLDYPADTKKPQPKHVWGLYDIGEMARMADTIVRGRAAAADFCEKAARILPKAKDGLLAAAKAYREEVSLARKTFEVFLTASEEDQKAWLSQEANREAGAVAIRQMLEKERAAVAVIEKALAAEGAKVSQTSAAPARTGARKPGGNVRREGGKVWIDGALNYDNADTGLSHVRTIACYLRNRGHKVDFDWLMGVSGEAFCYYYHPDGTSLSAMVHSYDVTNAALGPYGYRGRWERAAVGNDVQVILQSLEAHLSEGCPPIVPGALPSANMINSQCNRWFLVSGVDRRAETVTLLGAGREPVTTKLAKGDHPRPAGPHPCWYGMIRHVEPGRSDCIYGPDRPILVVQRTGEPASRRTAALAGLRQAVLRARETAAVAKRGWGAGTYLAGHAALQRLREDLVAAEGRDWEEFQRVNQPKGDPFGGLADELEHLHLLSARRRSASRFATAAAKALGAEAREQLLAAAKHYDGSARAAEEAFRIRYGSIEEFRRIQGLFQPGKDRDGDPRWKAYWQRADGALGDPAKRRAMAAKIGAALAAEQAALAEIEKALAAEGVKVGRGESTDSGPAGFSARPVDASVPIDIPRMDELKIDGDKSDWAAGGFRQLIIPIPPDPLVPRDDYSCVLRAAWSESGVYLLFEITDDAVRTDKAKPYWSDALHVHLASAEGGERVGMLLHPDKEALVLPLPHQLRARGQDLRAASKRRKGGYTIEAFAAWSALKTTPDESGGVCLWLRMLDSDKPEHRQMLDWVRPGVRGRGGPHRMRLAAGAGPALDMGAALRGGDDGEITASVVTRGGLAGRQAGIISAGKLVATARLEPRGDWAACEINLAARDLRLVGEGLTFAVAGPAGPAVSIPPHRVRDAKGRALRYIIYEPVVFRSACFAGEKFPPADFEHPYMMKARLGPYEIKTTYYDRKYNKVEAPDKPGRYGAVVEFTFADGRKVRRFRTLFKTPEGVGWWRDRFTCSVELPEQLGVEPGVAEKHAETIGFYLRERLAERLYERPGFAALLAGLYEDKDASEKLGRHNDVWTRDRQWWVGLKRKLYGTEEAHPRPFVCPRRIKGKPAPVVRAGSLKEAGMTADGMRAVDELCSKWAAESDEPFAVCIARNGVIALHKAYGERDGKAMTVTTKSWMASITKLLAGTLMMMVVDQGLVGLDDEVAKHLPAFRGVEVAAPLTVRHCYNHTSGLWGHWGDWRHDLEDTLAEHYPYLLVGRRYEYNGAGMALGGKVIEAITGEALPVFYHRHLLSPLGCENTDVAGSGGDARSVPLDMAKIGQMLLNQGSYGKMQFFRPGAFRRMLPRKMAGPWYGAYGVGTVWMNEDVLGKGTFGHGAGSSATFRVCPGLNMVVVMCRNQAGKNFAKYHGDFLKAIAAAVRKEPVGEPSAAPAEQKAPTVQATAASVEKEAGKMTVEEAGASIGKWGFRYDPVKWVESDRTLQGAMVRALVLKQPRAKDTRLLQETINAILAEQREDGSFAPPADKPKRTAVQETAGRAHELLKYGCPVDHPKLKKAVDFVCRAKLKKDGKLIYGELRLGCLTGWRQGDEPVKSLKAFAAKMKAEPERGACPWTIGEAPTLWDCRKLADVEEALASELRWNAERMNAAGFNSYKDPWAYLEQAGQLDHPLARQIVLKQIPMILRAQRPNGGWGGRTFAVLRALVRYDLLEPLRKLPALPADWRIVRSIPAPEKNLWTITWGDGKLWALCRAKKQAIAVSPETGEVVKRVPIPFKDIQAIGWWDDCLAMTKWEPKEVVKLDPNTGEIKQRIAIGKWVEEIGGVTQIGGRLWLADGWNWVCVRIDPKTPDKAEYVLMACPTGGMGTDMAAAGDGIWHFDNAWNAVVKTSVTAKAIPWNDKLAAGFWTPEPMDWGEKPPGCRVAGVAWDGQRLWVLDNSRKRICIVEKSGAKKWQPPTLGVGFIRKWLVCGPLPSPELPEKELAAIVEKRKDEPHVELLRAGHNIDYLKSVGGEARVRPKEGDALKRPNGSSVKWAKYVSPAEAIRLHEVFGGAGNEPMIAYAFATIHRAKAGKAYLALGSDDSAKVWLNGKLVHDAYVARPLEIDEDVVPVEFNAGENRLLVKVENVLGGGGFILRPLDSLPARGPAQFPGRRSTWSGFDRYDFKVNGRNCIVVTPSEPARGKPWIWRARFFGHEPQTDIALLNKGFHLVYMDVAGMWGSDEAVAHWDALYDFLTTKHGLSKKAALEGMSRGGLIIYNWGARNPEKVSCIYGDAPCCNFKMTRGFKEGEPHVDNAYLIEHILRPLAKAGVPLLHVCGDADESVPFEQHTRVVENRYKELGGKITVIVKPGVGHHPHSLKDPTPIVDFILKATSRN